jgi:hypothetical protein
VLREFEPNAYEIVMKELIMPTLFIDLWHQFSVNEIDHEPEDGPKKIRKDEFIKIAKKESAELKEVMLGRIENVQYKYLADFVGLWWIGVDPNNAILLCNVETGETRFYRKHGRLNIADLRIYRYKG